MQTHATDREAPRPATQAPAQLIPRPALSDNQPEWVALRLLPTKRQTFNAMSRPLLPAIACALSALSLTACRKDEIVTYRVVKDPAPATSGANTPAPTPANAATPTSSVTAPTAPGSKDEMATMANTTVTTASGPALTWTTPAAWTAGPERAMRKATLLIPGEAGAPGAEIAVTAFPGDVGGNLANVNRWRQQLALPPIGEAELGAALQHLHVGQLHVDVVELIGTAAPAQRVIGAIVPHAGATWFFKLTGPDALVAREKQNFLAFLQTVRPQG